jgi:hypothetical protein
VTAGAGRIATALLACALVAAGAAAAEEPEPSDDDVMRGFETPGQAAGGETPAEEPPPAERWWRITGALAETMISSYPDHRSTAGIDYHGLVGLRTRLDLQLDVDLPHEWKARAAGFGFYDFAYRIKGPSDFTNEVLNGYEWDADAGEVWVEGRLLPDLDAKIGRQVVNWGRSETLRVLDVLNPLDQRDPGLLDIVDLRRPVGMAKLAWNPGRHWSVTGIAIPELRYDKVPGFGSDFYPFPTPFPERRPESFHGHAEWAAAVAGFFEGWDVSFHFADVLENEPRLEANPSLPGGFRFGYSRLRMGGAGGNYAFGVWVLKAELAVLDGLDFATAGEKTRIDGMLGAEYYGIADSSFALDVVLRHIDDFQGSMRGFPDFARKDTVETSLRWSADWWNARLHTTALSVVFGALAQDGAVLRFTGDYDLRDGLSVGGGIQIWLPGGDADGRLDPFAQNDRIFARIKYSF